MSYPFGRCAECGYEFNSELRSEYEIRHCPKCGEPVDDSIFSETGGDGDIYCADCGRRIYRRQGDGGDWLDDTAGICAGGCDRAAMRPLRRLGQ
jgi:DNA-directed RNA polymerase subunit RPC12/RpoP